MYHDITSIIDTDLPDRTHQELVIASFDMFCTRKYSDILHGFKGEMIEYIFDDVCLR